MPRDRLLFKYTGENGEHYMGIPARDLYESDRASLSDDQLATLGASSFYRPRNEADEEVARAERRIGSSAAAGAPADAVSVTHSTALRAAGSEKPAKK